MIHVWMKLVVAPQAQYLQVIKRLISEAPIVTMVDLQVTPTVADLAPIPDGTELA